MKKGFTLIELLAVIVILAAITAIATPIVLNVVNDGKENAKLNSAELYLKAVDYSVTYELMNDYEIEDGTYKISESGNLCLDESCTNELSISASGERPTDGTIDFENGVLKDSYLVYEDMIIEKTDGEVTYMKLGDPICIPVTDDEVTTGNIPKGNFDFGDEYICEVKPGVKYHFFVIGLEDKRVNLILNRNINSDGTLANEAVSSTTGVYSLTPWISKEDYLSAGGDESLWLSEYEGDSNGYGPITVTRFLDNATSNWTNLPSISDKNKKKTRLPNETEISKLYDEINELPLWLVEYLDLYMYQQFTITGFYGYWMEDAYCAKDDSSLYVGNQMYHDYTGVDAKLGVRPVISLIKYQIEN